MHCTSAVNGFLHIGWVEIFVKHAFWLAVCIVQPYLVMAYLAISLVVSVLTRLFGRGTMRPSEEQAVVVTGCDTGFGHDFALTLAEAGFTVFAGCLREESCGPLKAKVVTGGSIPDFLEH